MSTIDRREFLAAGMAGSVAITGELSSMPAAANQPVAGGGRFRLNYAPHFGMFRHLAGDDPLDQVRFMAEEGFRAVEDVGLRLRPSEWQGRVGREIALRGMAWGAFVATSDCGRPTFAAGSASLRDAVLRDVNAALQLAERMNAKWLTVVPGKADSRLPRAAQFSHAVELLARCAAPCERRGRVLLLEPLSRAGMFLRTLPQADELCRAVGSPACKVLCDVSQQPVSTERLLRAIDRSWDQIGYFQVGDNPGRKEPGTGRVDFRRVLGHIWSLGYGGLIGMDHGNSQPGEAGEQRVIEAYAALSNESSTCIEA